MKKVGLKEFFDLMIYGSDEELLSCEVKEEEKISCEDMIIACKTMVSMGATTKEAVEALSSLPGRRI